MIAVGSGASIAAEIAEKGGVAIKSFEDSESACNKLEKIIKDSDIVLVKGSRVSGLEVVVERLEELYG